MSESAVDAAGAEAAATEFRLAVGAIESQVSATIVGQREAIRGVMISLVLGGHALLANRDSGSGHYPSRQEPEAGSFGPARKRAELEEARSAEAHECASAADGEQATPLHAPLPALQPGGERRDRDIRRHRHGRPRAGAVDAGDVTRVGRDPAHRCPGAGQSPSPTPHHGRHRIPAGNAKTKPGRGICVCAARSRDA